MRLLPVLLPAVLACVPALAQDLPSCGPGREGMVACFGEKLCACRWAPGGTLTGRPPGHRWDCGVLRPACGVTPAGPPPGESPPISVMPFLQQNPAPSADGSAAQGSSPQAASSWPGGTPAPDPRLTPRNGAAAAPRGTR
ncbi:hypothetical protein E2C06_16775 [Dankookia rubra]|uniref:Uncharacterized protein n=1 Tax=Dankookia rubra TaxID=1442381 RepID=A0A4R5QFF7_9PROT|nr:hypothetical protein [Dankookia rubra]TDH61438.1 hypothetical protein E2C06_16775 [Dankookia rubra]